MLRHVVLAAFALSIAAPASAQDFRASNGLVAGQVGGDVYEVVGRPGRSSADAFWCAAGDYARHRLGARGTDRIYVVEPRGPSSSSRGRPAVRFTLDPEAAGIAPITPRISLSVDHVGDSISVSLAQQYCIVEIDTF